MKKFLLGTAVAAMLLAGCSKDDDAPISGQDKQEDYTEIGASLGLTRTTLQGTKINWSANDVLSLYSDEVTTPRQYNIIDGVGASVAKFRSTDGEGVRGTTYYAVYPNSMVVGAGQISLPAEQNYYQEENFATNSFPMAAKSTDRTQLVFENLCGIIVLELGADQTGVLVNSIDVTTFGGQGQALSGAATIDFSGETPVLNCSGNNKLSLNCNGVSLPANETKAFYMVVPAGTYNDVRIQVNAETIGGEIELTKTRTTQFVVNAGAITRIGASFTFITKTYAVGDLYPDDIDPVGVVYETSDNGRSGKVVAMNDCTEGGAVGEEGSFYSYNWGPDTAAGITAKTGNARDGAAIMASIGTNIAKYPAFQACAVLGDGWYLPASAEMTTLMEVYGDVEGNLASPMVVGIGYWCSNTTGIGKHIYYFDTIDNVLKTVAPAGQKDVTNAVRAIMAF